MRALLRELWGWQVTDRIWGWKLRWGVRRDIRRWKRSQR